MGHRGGGGHQGHSRIHAARAREEQARLKDAKRERGGSRTQVKKMNRGKKK